MNYTDLQILNQTCFSAINPIWLWCIIHYWIQLAKIFFQILLCHEGHWSIVRFTCHVFDLGCLDMFSCCFFSWQIKSSHSADSHVNSPWGHAAQNTWLVALPFPACGPFLHSLFPTVPWVPLFCFLSTQHRARPIKVRQNIHSSKILI